MLTRNECPSAQISFADIEYVACVVMPDGLARQLQELVGPITEPTTATQRHKGRARTPQGKEGARYICVRVCCASMLIYRHTCTVGM